MSFAEWNDRLSVGLKLLDDDHKRLLDLAKRIHVLCRDPGKEKDAEKVLGELVDYMKTHFIHEETLMRRSAYPRFIPHKIEHDRFFKQIEDYRKGLAATQVCFSQESIQFIETGLFDHFTRIDKPLGDWLVKNHLQILE